MERVFVNWTELLWLHVTLYQGIGFERATPGVIFSQVYPVTGLGGGHPLGEPLEPLRRGQTACDVCQPDSVPHGVVARHLRAGQELVVKHETVREGHLCCEGA